MLVGIIFYRRTWLVFVVVLNALAAMSDGYLVELATKSGFCELEEARERQVNNNKLLDSMIPPRIQKIMRASPTKGLAVQLSNCCVLLADIEGKEIQKGFTFDLIAQKAVVVCVYREQRTAVSCEIYIFAPVRMVDRLPIAGFTSFSAQLPPEVLVTLLNQLFSAFDAACKYFDVTKIETIGDAYLAATGCLPSANAIRRTKTSNRKEPVRVSPEQTHKQRKNMFNCLWRSLFKRANVRPDASSGRPDHDKHVCMKPDCAASYGFGDAACLTIRSCFNIFLCNPFFTRSTLTEYKGSRHLKRLTRVLPSLRT